MKILVNVTVATLLLSGVAASIPAYASSCIGICGTVAATSGTSSIPAPPSNLFSGTYNTIGAGGTSGAGNIPGVSAPIVGSEYTTDAFSATAGQSISFYSNFAAGGNDAYGFAQLLQVNGTTGSVLSATTIYGAVSTGQFFGTGIVQPAVATPLAVTSGNTSSTGWIQTLYNISAPGTYALRFGEAVIRQSGGGGISANAVLAFSNPTVDNLTIGNGSSITNPLLPVRVDPRTGGASFQFNAAPSEVVYIDPLVATGYDYVVNSGPNILSAIFPELGDANGYQIYALNGGVLGSLLGTVMGNTTFSFGPGGVSAFALRDINTALALDPANPVAFVTGLTFNVTGSTQVNISQTPVTTFVGGNGGAVPEPSTWLSMLAGFGAMGFAMRRGKQQARVRFAV
jgi:hypothetical protein